MMSNDELHSRDPFSNPPINPNPNPNPSKRKRNLPGTPDPDAEVIAMSPKSLMATNRFVCEICNKGFQRDQNLQLHRRGHNLPWKLKQRNKEEVVRKKVYICPDKSFAHNHPSRALGDLTGIKKHYSRKHGEKKWKCDKCSKKYAVVSDWKAHNKICGTREYKCDCGTLFSRKDSFITHRAFCDALVEETAWFGSRSTGGIMNTFQTADFQNRFPLWLESANYPTSSSSRDNYFMNLSEEMAQLDSQWLKEEDQHAEENKRNLCETAAMATSPSPSLCYQSNTSSSSSAAPMSATALLQKAAQMGSTRSSGFGLVSPSSISTMGFDSFKRSRNDESADKDEMGRRGSEGESSLTRDFLGVGRKELKSNFFASITSAMENYNRNH